ncbi:hypothetical protein [Companilactobacillus nodensis]|uniref:hypothetical protein n=1 Tax=Companilactobacillus nodensis TaxID=460870 RepID=UPI00046AEABE|nr:hypothetical protein [Companilactobacillus nodensis]
MENSINSKYSLDLYKLINGDKHIEMNFDGKKLTDEEKEQFKMALTQVFWKKLKSVEDSEGRDSDGKY